MKYYGRNQLGTVSVNDKSTYMENPYPDGFAKVNIPEGVSGDWKVVRFTVTEEDIGLYNLRLIRDGRRDRIVPPGDYTRLVHVEDGTVMSDTPAEAWEHDNAYSAARGNVLVNGLGLGFFLAAILRKKGIDAVTRVTVIEKSLDVIALVGGSFNDTRVSIIHADAFEYKPPQGEQYDFVWHDIWPMFSDENKPEMAKLRRKYARCAKLQGCWSSAYL